MKKFLGLLLGAGLGAALAALLAHFKGEALQAHYQSALAAGREASAKKRQELEVELKEGMMTSEIVIPSEN